jgi:outer membrane protein OmpA-like peptidoglycan-associated protein
VSFVDGKGATEPVAPDETEEHRKADRRVVVTYDW